MSNSGFCLASNDSQAQPELPTDPNTVGRDELFAFQPAPGEWVVAYWGLTPKLYLNGTLVPLFWVGPGSRTWIGALDGRVPLEAARFDSPAAAAAAIATENRNGRRDGR